MLQHENRLDSEVLMNQPVSQTSYVCQFPGKLNFEAIRLDQLFKYVSATRWLGET